MSETTPSRSGIPVLVVFVGAALSLFLCAATGASAYWLGRSQAPNTAPVAVVTATGEASPVRVESEVTRIVEVTRLLELPPTAEPPSPTATPSPTVTEETDIDSETDDVVPRRTPLPTLTPGTRGEFTPEDLALLWEVWEQIELRYDGNVPDDEALRYAIVGFVVDSLGDPFTVFVPADVASRNRELIDGSFEGIGALVELTEAGQLRIVRPFADQPASRAGIQSGDIVLAVDGQSLDGFTLNESVSLVRGPAGTSVTLTILREDAQPFDVTVVRGVIETPVIEARMLPGNVGYVRLAEFNRNAEQQLSEAIVELFQENPVGLILDLRDNPGGLLNQSVEVADLFLDDGIVLFDRNSSGDELVYRSSDGDIAEDIPLVVLVNEASASASEIVAGAVQDRERATIIGNVSFGKGSVQNVLTLSDGSDIRITIARWFTPNNNTIDFVGILPDIVVEQEGEFGSNDDSQIQRAVDFLLNGT